MSVTDMLQRFVSEVLPSAGAAGFVLYFPLKKFIENKFNKSLEDFKSQRRLDEDDLRQARDFMSSSRKERSDYIFLKKTEAAEILMKSIDKILGMSAVVYFVREIDLDVIIKEGRESQVRDAVKELMDALMIDELNKQEQSIDKAILYLYLDEKTLDLYSAYSDVVYEAWFRARLIQTDISWAINHIKKPSKLVDLVVKIYPDSEDAFAKYGSKHVFSYMERLYKDLQICIRKELFGEGYSPDIHYNAVQLSQQFRMLRNLPGVTKEGSVVNVK